MINGALNQSTIGTLVQRNIRLQTLVKRPQPNPATAAIVVQSFTNKLNAVAQPKRKTLIIDRGTEMNHQQLNANMGIAVFF